MSYTVDQWIDHTEIALGYKAGETAIGDVAWTRRIYADYIRGRASFGATATNATEAKLHVVMKHDPDKYPLALKALEEQIRIGREQGKPLIKLRDMYLRMSKADRV